MFILMFILNGEIIVFCKCYLKCMIIFVGKWWMNLVGFIVCRMLIVRVLKVSFMFGLSERLRIIWEKM